MDKKHILSKLPIDKKHINNNLIMNKNDKGHQFTKMWNYPNKLCKIALNCVA